MKRYAIIVAGGTGTRMQAQLPKQFLLLNGEPILMHSIKVFVHAVENINIILVLPKEWQAYWRELCSQYQFTIKHSVVDGGETRFHSVKNGIVSIADEQGIVAVHDAVRPLVSTSLIQKLFDLANEQGNAIPVIPVNDSLRQVQDNDSIMIDRTPIRSVQTPQCAQLTLLKHAFAQPYQTTFTDEASVMQMMGARIFLAEGEESNIKITRPFDLIIAEAVLKERGI